METLSQFFLAHTQGKASHDLFCLVNDIVSAGKAISRDLSRSWITGLDGSSETVNVQGEQQKRMDKTANRHFRRCLAEGGLCDILISEEEPHPLKLRESPGKGGRHVVAVDPLDGSSNMGLNLPVGSIFSIYKLKGTALESGDQQVLQKGRMQLAAGYFLYGPATMLVLALNGTVNGFTLESSGGEFLRSHPNICIPEHGPVYAINEGLSGDFADGLKDFIGQLKDDQKTRYSGRYSGSMVADVHRILFRGGIFMYPGTGSSPAGKLRLVYENSPMAFIMEMAGGAAIDGCRSILDILPGSVHERCPVYLGSVTMISCLKRILQHSAALQPLQLN